jgi:hypothetical protein
MDGDGVSVRVGKHESPPEWTVERRGDNSNAGINKPIVQGLGVIGFEPQRDAPAETVDRMQINGGLTNGEGNGSGGKDDRSWWALGCPLKAKLLRIERGRRLEVADL